MKKVKTVDEYIATSVEEARPIMEELREIIKSTVPEAEERIAWSVPNYKMNGVLSGSDKRVHSPTSGNSGLMQFDCVSVRGQFECFQ